MLKFKSLGVFALNGSLLAGLIGGPAFAETRSHHEDHVLGTSLDIKAIGSASAWNIAIAAARVEMQRLDAVLSAWRPDSELAALNQAARFEASQDLFAVVAHAERIRAATNGGFSPRLGLPIQLQRAGAGAEELEQSIVAAEQAGVSLNPFGRVIEKDPSVAFDLDAIAKGYVLDRALLAARRTAPDLRGIMIDIGGDIAVWGEGPNDGGWRLGVAQPGVQADNAKPLQIAYLRNQAIATSGRGARDVLTLDGSANHVLSPKSGAPANAVSQATVIAPNAKLADALATAFSVMSPSESLALADSMPGVAALIAHIDGAHYRSGRWPIYASGAGKSCDVAVAGAQIPWPDKYSLSVDIDIPRQKETDAKRPYVSVWISNKQKQLVRTLLVLGDKARWRENNYIWWRRFERLQPEAVQGMSRPTRAPGKYNVLWDGKNDAGRSVGQGKYVLNVEISREHGGHSFQSIPLDIGAAAFDASAEASQEINATKARFGPSK